MKKFKLIFANLYHPWWIKSQRKKLKRALKTLLNMDEMMVNAGLNRTQIRQFWIAFHKRPEMRNQIFEGMLK